MKKKISIIAAVNDEHWGYEQNSDFISFKEPHRVSIPKRHFFLFFPFEGFYPTDRGVKKLNLRAGYQNQTKTF